MTSVVENLKAAKALIDTPEKWGKDSFCSNGKRCAFGALIGVGAFKAPEIRALELAHPEGTFGAVASFNDAPDTTHADIMALFDRAIAAEEAKEAAA
jgi:hypothetical protein